MKIPPVRLTPWQKEVILAHHGAPTLKPKPGRDMGTVAPHLNKEVQLVLGGTKPLATIERSKDLTGYCLAVQLIGAGLLIGNVNPTSDDCTGEVVFTLPVNRHNLREYAQLQDRGVAEMGLKWYHRQMGKLFGYSEADVEAFILAEITCECSKCIGS